MPIDSSFMEDPINEAALFNYFLNDDLANYSYDEASLSPCSSESPQTSPPHLLPDSPELDTPQLAQILLDPSLMDKAFVQVKEETAGLRKDINATTSINSPELPNPTNPSRKRALKDATVALSRDELLKLSSKGLESFAQNVATSRPLTPEEERQLKRQRRLIKNRESAQLSRMRKKIYIEELERKVNHLTSENDNLTKQLYAISTDKRKLEEEVAYLQSIIKQSPQLSQMQVVRPASPPKLSSSKNVKTAGICLLIVLFSFGMLFNTGNTDFALSRGSATGRSLKTIKEDPVKESRRETDPVAGAVQAAVESVEKRRVDTGKKEGSARKPADIQPVAPASVKRKRITIDDESAPTRADLVPVSATDQAVQVKQDSLQVLPNGITHSLGRPDTDYIYCSEAQQVHANGVTHNRAPQNIALLIPSSVLNTTFSNRLDNSLLEVTCQILNLHLWPLSTVPNTTNTMKP